MKPPTRPWVRFLRLAFLVLVGGWLVWVLIGLDYSTPAAGNLWLAPPTWIFALGWLALPIGLGLLWMWSLRVSAGVRLPIGSVMATQGLAWGGRYLPGKAGMLLAKLALAGRHGAGIRSLSQSVVVEQWFFLFAGAMVAAAMMPWIVVLTEVVPQEFRGDVISTFVDSPNRVLFQVVVIAILVGLAIVALWLAGRLFGHRLAWSQWKLWVVIFLGHLALHMAVGLSLYPLVALLAPDSADMLGVTGIIAAFAFANIAGILAVFAPAGLGVRDGALALFLAIGIDPAAALSVAAFVRLITVIVDAVFAFAGWSIGRFLARTG